MSVCSACGNDYDKAFTVTLHDGETFTFDSLECAIATVAIECVRCGCKIIGHGHESDGRFYCCAHCAIEAGEKGLADRAGD